MVETARVFVAGQRVPTVAAALPAAFAGLASQWYLVDINRKTPYSRALIMNICLEKKKTTGGHKP